MKKLFAFLLLFSLLLTGCNHGVAEPEQTQPTSEVITTVAPTESETVELPVFSVPMITVSVPLVTDEVTDEDGTVIFRSTKQNMQLVMPDPEVADRIILDFLNRVDAIAADSADILAQAQSAYSGQSNWTPYLSSITYEPMRVDQCVISLYGSNVRYSGAAHAATNSCAANYNVITGDVLTLGSIIVDSGSIDELCSLVTAQLQTVAEEKYLRQGFEETVKQRFSTDESFDENWYFSSDGLCFYFDPYAIAPYASGVITAEIPYSDLIGVIDDSFFPPEQEGAIGTIYVENAENVDVTTFTRISEIVLKPEASMYVLYTDGAVQNVRILLNDAQLGGGCTIFGAQSLSKSDAIIIQAEVNLFSLLEIEYESDGQVFTMPLISE